MAWAISDRANIDLTYRYLTGDAEFATTSSNAAFSQGVFEGDYDNSHTVTLGLRYAFGPEEMAPPPPPPPVVAPPPPPPPPPPVVRPPIRHGDGVHLVGGAQGHGDAFVQPRRARH